MLQGAGNIADEYAKDLGAGFGMGYEALDDGYLWHAPVDEFRANAFGLHGVLGNVNEWCLDGMNDDFYQRCTIEVAVDPVGPETKPGGRLIRGGDFESMAHYARSANRGYATTEEANAWLGLRPACEIQGEIRYARGGDSAR